MVMPLGWIFRSFTCEYLQRANRGQALRMAINNFPTFHSPDNSTEIIHRYNCLIFIEPWRSLAENELVFFWTVCNELKDTCFLRYHCIKPSVQGCYIPTLSTFCIGYLFLPWWWWLAGSVEWTLPSKVPSYKHLLSVCYWKSILGYNYTISNE